MTCAWMDTSSADTGSSQMISFGWKASARATPIRCRWPPENSAGNRLKCSGLSPTRSISSCTRRLRSAPEAVRWMANGSPMIDPTRRRGFSDPIGSWKIIWISRRSGRMRRCETGRCPRRRRRSARR